MTKHKLSSKQNFVENLLIGLFTSLFLVFFTALIVLFQTLVSHPNDPEEPTVTIKDCYDGDTCTTTEGEVIRLACINAPELKGKQSDLISAKSSRDYLNHLVKGSSVTIKRITKDRYGRTVAEIFKGTINIQEKLVIKGLASVYKNYSSQCSWSK